jgi:Ca2+-dependent lipid-binding protein
VNYDSKCSDLQIHLIEAHNLVPFEEGGFREVYVRLELKPEIDQRKRETNIFRFDTNPYFNQHFKFPVSRDQLSEKELILLVSCGDKSLDENDFSPLSVSCFPSRHRSSTPTNAQATYQAN